MIEPPEGSSIVLVDGPEGAWAGGTVGLATGAGVGGTVGAGVGASLPLQPDRTMAATRASDSHPRVILGWHVWGSVRTGVRPFMWPEKGSEYELDALDDAARAVVSLAAAVTLWLTWFGCAKYKPKRSAGKWKKVSGIACAR
jgi:hypothetical protein